MTAPITNISTKGIIHVEQVYTVGNQNGLDVTRVSIQKIVESGPYAIKERAHDVLIAKLNANSKPKMFITNEA